MVKQRSLVLRILVGTVLIAGFLAGCSSDDDSDDAATSTTETTISDETSSTTETTNPNDNGENDNGENDNGENDNGDDNSGNNQAQACTSGYVEPPSEVAQGTIVDVDGDGEADQGWVGMGPDGIVVGINTAAGGGASVPFESGSPVERSLLAVNADEKGPVELFLSDGRTVSLYAFVDCDIVPITNEQGETYQFSLGFTDFGTGIGCAQIDGKQQLVGLNVDSTDTDGSVNWSRTVIELDGTNARNGATSTGTFTSPDDDDAIALLYDISCGDLTMANDGVVFHN